MADKKADSTDAVVKVLTALVDNMTERRPVLALRIVATFRGNAQLGLPANGEFFFSPEYKVKTSDGQVKRWDPNLKIHFLPHSGLLEFKMPDGRVRLVTASDENIVWFEV